MKPTELKFLRMDAGMTQGELAEAIGVCRLHVLRMESGAKPIHKRSELSVRYVVSKALGRIV